MRATISLRSSPALPSVVLSLATILPVIYGLKELAKQGFGFLPLLSIAFGVCMGIVFVARQRSLDSPLVDLRLFRSRAFTAALGGMFGVTLTGANMRARACWSRRWTSSASSSVRNAA
jgi:DHA2 family multidrug resistance protein-like MFS transporter